MIISIYGLERSGKTTLIKKLQNLLGLSAYHFRKSKCLHNIADCLNVEPELNNYYSEKQKSMLIPQVEKMLDYLNHEYKYILMDCHALFYEQDKGYFDFRKPSFHEGSDIYFYLKTSPELIFKRMQDTNGQKATYNHSIERIKEWQHLECQMVNNLAKKQNKPFIILDENTKIESIKKNLDENM